MTPSSQDRRTAREITDSLFNPEHWAESFRREITESIFCAIKRVREEEKEACLKIVQAEPELPGRMPDEMWAMIKNDRDASEEAQRIAVRLTKKNVAAAIRGRGEKIQ